MNLLKVLQDYPTINYHIVNRLVSFLAYLITFLDLLVLNPRVYNLRVMKANY